MPTATAHLDFDYHQLLAAYRKRDRGEPLTPFEQAIIDAPVQKPDAMPKMYEPVKRPA